MQDNPNPGPGINPTQPSENPVRPHLPEAPEPSGPGENPPMSPNPEIPPYNPGPEQQPNRPGNPEIRPLQ